MFLFELATFDLFAFPNMETRQFLKREKNVLGNGYILESVLISLCPIAKKYVKLLQKALQITDSEGNLLILERERKVSRYPYINL